MVDLLAPPSPTVVAGGPVEAGIPPAADDPTTPIPSPSWWRKRPYPLLARWLVLIAAVGLGFHQTLVSVAVQSTNGDPLAYLLLLPVWGALLVFGTQLRRGRDLDIHDRQVDWVLAIGLAGFILMLDVLLRPRLGDTAGLVRIDILALVLFVMLASILLCGTRATGQSWAAWLFLLACWPLLYRLIGAALGGTTDTYGLLNVMLSTLAVMVASGRPLGRRLANGGITLVVGGVVFAALSTSLPPIAVQVIPSLVALPLVVAFDVRRHRGTRHLPAPSAGANSVVKKPVTAMLALLVLGGALGMFAQFAPETISPRSLPVSGPGWTNTAVVPSGWATHGRQAESWAGRYFGAGSTWYRYKFVTAAGLNRQHIMVDALTAPSVGPLSVYPAISCYRLFVPYVQSATSIPLGHGVTATVIYANAYSAPSPVQAQWALITWTWKIPGRTTTTYQRMTVLTLEDPTSVAGFPVPAAPGANNSVRTTFTNILRGVSTTASPAPTASTMNRMIAFSKQVVAQQSAASST
jgi:hypothetical protein